MRADLVPVTSAALDRIKLLLLNMARDATLVALEDVTARIQHLEARPTQLDDFVNYMVRPWLLAAGWAVGGKQTAACTCEAGCQHTHAQLSQHGRTRPRSVRTVVVTCTGPAQAAA